MSSPIYLLKRRARSCMQGRMGIPIRAMLLASLLPLLLEYPFALLLNTESSGIFQLTLYYIVVFLLGVLGEVLRTGRCMVHICMERGEYVHHSFVFYGLKNSSDHYFKGAFFLQTISFLFSFPISLQLSRINLQTPDPAQNDLITGLALATMFFTLLTRILFGLYYYVMLDFEESSLWSNLRTTFALLREHVLRLLLLYLSFIGLEFLCLLTFGIALLWVSLYMEQATACFYQDCLNHMPTADQ